jgi:hypothetical protein
MVPKKIAKDDRTITINCGTTCQKVGEAAGTIAAILVGIPVCAFALLLFGRAVYTLLSLVDDSRDYAIAGLMSIFATVITLGLIIVIVGFTVSTWDDKQ